MFQGEGKKEPDIPSKRAAPAAKKDRENRLERVILNNNPHSKQVSDKHILLFKL